MLTPHSPPRHFLNVYIHQGAAGETIALLHSVLETPQAQLVGGLCSAFIVYLFDST